MENIEEITLHYQESNFTPLVFKIPIDEMAEELPSIYINSLESGDHMDVIGYYRRKEWTKLSRGKWKCTVKKSDLMLIFNTAFYLNLDYHYEDPVILDSQSYQLYFTVAGEDEKRKFEWFHKTPKGCADLGIIASRMLRMAGI